MVTEVQSVVVVGMWVVGMWRWALGSREPVSICFTLFGHLPWVLALDVDVEGISDTEPSLHFLSEKHGH